MATLFTHINTGQFPFYTEIKEIHLTIQNISLNISKHNKAYTRFIYLKVVYWLQNGNIIAEEQGGFRGKQSALDCYVVL